MGWRGQKPTLLRPRVAGTSECQSHVAVQSAGSHSRSRVALGVMELTYTHGTLCVRGRHLPPHVSFSICECEKSTACAAPTSSSDLSSVRWHVERHLLCWSTYLRLGRGTAVGSAAEARNNK